MKLKEEIYENVALSCNSYCHKSDAIDMIEQSMNEIRNEILHILSINDYYGLHDSDIKKLQQDIKNIKIW
jgi:hypothetical protein